MKTMYKIERVVANPSKNTFSIPPIKSMVKRYLAGSSVSVDPFARNNSWATYTNDLNPETSASSHALAFDFLVSLRAVNVCADLVLFDPPYTRRQVKEVYDSVGPGFTNKDSQDFSLNWKREREVIDSILSVGGFVISFGYNSSGMRYSGSYEIVELMLVCHGGAHYDTICLVERKVASSPVLF